MVEKCRAKPRDLRHCAFDGVGDVVQLEVEEDLFAGGGEPRDKFESAAIGELHPDLVKSDAIADFIDQLLGLRDIGHIEGDDQPLARRNVPVHDFSRRARRSVPRGAVTKNIERLATPDLLDHVFGVGAHLRAELGPSGAQ